MRQVAGLGRFGFKPRSWVREVCLHRGFFCFLFLSLAKRCHIKLQLLCFHFGQNDIVLGLICQK